MSPRMNINNSKLIKIKEKKAKKIGKSKFFSISEIDFMLDLLINHAQFSSNSPMSKKITNELNLWDLTGEPCNLILPKWFDKNLSSSSKEFKQQQLKLWKLISGKKRDYNFTIDEKEEEMPSDIDPIRKPGWFMRKGDDSILNCSVHKIASGKIMNLSNLKPGQNAIEFGAGFGHTALDLARLGVNVDTVDISKTYCKFIKKQADFFKVNLTPYHNQFGFYPSNKKYDFIWFYEAFHHALNFEEVIKGFKNKLNKNGRILLAAEPITTNGSTSQIPLDWGLRLDKLAVCATRWRGWFELGFNEDFLISLFVNNGFEAEYHPCNDTFFGNSYVFTHRKNIIDLSSNWLPFEESNTWNKPESNGRCSKLSSFLSLDTTSKFKKIKISMANPTLRSKNVKVTYGKIVKHVKFLPQESKSLIIDAKIKAPKIFFEILGFYPRSLILEKIFKSQTILCKIIRKLFSVLLGIDNARIHGILVNQIHYINK